MIFTYLPANYIPKLHLLGTYNFDFKSCQLRMTEFIFNLMHSDSVNQLTKIDNAFGVVLRKKRLGKKMTQEVLASKTGLRKTKNQQHGHYVRQELADQPNDRRVRRLQTNH